MASAKTQISREGGPSPETIAAMTPEQRAAFVSAAPAMPVGTVAITTAGPPASAVPDFARLAHEWLLNQPVEPDDTPLLVSLLKEVYDAGRVERSAPNVDTFLYGYDAGRQGIDPNLALQAIEPALQRHRLPITHVALRFKEQVWSLPRPFRHHNIIRVIATLTGATTIDCSESRGDQGFLDSSGRYLTRKQALVNALLHKQVKDENDIRHNMLFSEDLW